MTVFLGSSCLSHQIFSRYFLLLLENNYLFSYNDNKERKLNFTISGHLQSSSIMDVTSVFGVVLFHHTRSNDSRIQSILEIRVPDTSDTSATRTTECDTSETRATRVRQECYTNDTNATRVKTYFHTFILTLQQMKDYKERNNFILRTTFPKCLAPMPKCI